jgi:tetratricopeptide (TPR) repeat protein/transcriptional regulator with XRE-family HTH domain
MAGRPSQPARTAQANFGALLRAHRRRLPLTQEQLAERAGLSERTLRNLEGGRVHRPYPNTIRRLADALNLTGEERQDFEAAARQVTLDPSPAAGSRSDPPGAPPRQLPLDVADFTGRSDQVALLRELLCGTAAVRPATAVVSAVAGKAGVGKTALAVHVAHQLREVFPDGQLYVNLHGAEPHPLEAAAVLARFLRSLGLDAATIPVDQDEREALYRACLADRRVLVVLDDAASEAQVRPLLPGSPTCRVLVTSRARLTGLEGAQLLDVDILPLDAAVELLARVAGPARITAESDAAAAIVGYCGRLPLAIRIAGARLAARPAWTLARLAERLADEHRRLDELAAGDLEVRASIALSYRTLPEPQQRAFRRLGLLAAPDFPAWVAGALLDVPSERAETLIEALVDAQLLEAGGIDQAGQARYRFHDLLRVYARERALGDDGPDERTAALLRAFGGALFLAGRAAAATKAGTLGLVHGDLPRWRPGPGITRLVDAEPLAWFEAERSTLVAAVEQAAASLDEVAWDLAGCLARFFAVRSYFDDWRRTQEAGLAAARRLGHRRGQAQLLRGLGLLHNEQDRLDAATACFEQARALFVAVGDRGGEAGALDDLGVLHQLRGHTSQALACLEPALAIFAEAGDPVGEANVRFSLALVYLDQGDYDRAEADLEAARPVLEAADDRYTLGQLLRKLAQLHRTQGRLDEAAAVLDRCLIVDRALGDRLGEALTLQSLGELQRRQDHRRLAQTTLEQALATLRDLRYPYGEALALRSLGLLHLADGRPHQALVDLGESLALWRRLGRPRNEAHTLTGLGDAHTAAGDRAAAGAAWRQALAIFQELGAPDADSLAERLSTAAADPGP